MDGYSPLVWVLLVLGVISAIKNMIRFALPDIQDSIDRIYTFREWLHRRRKQFKEQT